MNKITKPAATLTLGVRSYESPTANVVEVVSEGVLCASNALSVKEWENDTDFSW